MNKYPFLPNSLSVFFGTDGLSMSEANHIANMAKELNKSVAGDIR